MLQVVLPDAGVVQFAFEGGAEVMERGAVAFEGEVDTRAREPFVGHDVVNAEGVGVDMSFSSIGLNSHIHLHVADTAPEVETEGGIALRPPEVA